VNDALVRRHGLFLRGEIAMGDEAEKKTPQRQKPLTETQAQARADVAALYYSVQDVLAAFPRPISKKTLERLEQRGEGPPRTVLPGRIVVYRKSLFHQWLEGFGKTPRRVRPRRATSSHR
jgi:hypothetical protein